MIIACIPAYNEASTISSVVTLTKNFVDLVIVIDDGSLDNTGQLAEGAGAIVVRHSRNLGKGAAVKTGFIEALKHNPTIVIILDGDGQHDPSDIPKFLSKLELGNYGVIIGSRYNKESIGNIPFYRLVGLNILYLINNLFISNDVEDIQSGFRAFTKESVLLLLEAKETGYNIEMEQIMILSNMGVRIGEVPIKVNYKVPHPSKKNPFYHGFELLGYMINIIITQRSLLFIGAPGIFLLFLSLFLFRLLTLFNENYYFSILISLTCIGSLLFGIILLINSFILFYILNIRKKYDDDQLTI